MNIEKAFSFDLLAGCVLGFAKNLRGHWGIEPTLKKQLMDEVDNMKSRINAEVIAQFGETQAASVMASWNMYGWDKLEANKIEETAPAAPAPVVQIKTQSDEKS